MVIGGSPTDPSLAYLGQLAIANVATLKVDNSASSIGVNWTAGDGELSAVVPSTNTQANDLLSIGGAGSVQILGGSGSNALSLESLAGSTTATINGADVTLVAGKNVLQTSGFDTYSNLSQLNQLINFSGLTATATSYTQTLSSGSVTLTSYGADVGTVAFLYGNVATFSGGLPGPAFPYVGETVTGVYIPAGTTITSVSYDSGSNTYEIGLSHPTNYYNTITSITLVKPETPDLVPDASLATAVKLTASGATYTLTASDGWLFAMYGIALSTGGGPATSVTFTGTTADGQSVPKTFNVPQSDSFAYFTFPSTFTALTGVTWTPGSTLATNIVVSELFKAVTPGPAPVSVPTVNNSSSGTVTFNADSLTINGSHSIVPEPGGYYGPNYTYYGGTFNGTPWYSYGNPRKISRS